MKITVLVLALLFSSLILFSCQNNSVSSEDNVQPGRRDYIWTADTLVTQNNRIQCIWGSSPTDVWAGGAGGITPYDRLWHFDGNVWRPYNQHVSVFPTCIFGFAQNDVWMGGNDGKIFHFNGSTWSQNYRYWSDTLYTTAITDIIGISPDDIYAIGILLYKIDDNLKSFILHYNGENWTALYITTESVQFLKIQGENTTIYILGYISQTVDNPSMIAFYQLNGNEFTKIFQKPTSEITWGSLAQIGDNTYFQINKDLMRYQNGKFQTIMAFNIDNFSYHAYGRNEKDIFLTMIDGLAHYNGINVEYLYHFNNSNTSIFKPLIMQKNIFYSGADYENDINFILRGKLQE